MRVYLAGPLFTPYQRGFLDQLAARLRDNSIEVFVPHEQLLDGPLTPTEVFRTDADGVRDADVLLAVLDGTEVDDGTACEIGMFAERLHAGTRCGAIIGLMTDIRTLRDAGDPPRMNLFVRGCIETYGSIHTDPDSALAAVQTLAAQVDSPSTPRGG